MAKPRWDRKPCGCVKANLKAGKVMIRCTQHRGKPCKGRVLCYFGEHGQVTLDVMQP